MIYIFMFLREAVPKDGPSAGITMLSSILSALTQRPINANYAMTGELKFTW